MFRPPNFLVTVVPPPSPVCLPQVASTLTPLCVPDPCPTPPSLLTPTLFTPLCVCSRWPPPSLLALCWQCGPQPMWKTWLASVQLACMSPRLVQVRHSALAIESFGQLKALAWQEIPVFVLCSNLLFACVVLGPFLRFVCSSLCPWLHLEPANVFIVR